MTDASRVLIYGANGYTGDLIARLAVSQGLRPIVAGRTANSIETLAKQLGLEHRVFGLDTSSEVDRGLEDIDVVVHCAGPFSRTARAMAQGCIRTHAHYLDITGEIEVFELMASLGPQAEEAGVMLLPGAGFDIVPSDCLAAYLKLRLETATHLTLAIRAIGTPSRGTATTMVENLHKGGMIRKHGKLTPVASAWKTRETDFGYGPVFTMTIPWGDVSSAYYSTGIGNIEVYMSVPSELKRLAVFSRYFGWLLASRPVQGLLKKKIQAGPAGPTEKQRAGGRSLLWGEVADDAGNVARARMETPDGYTLTASTALSIALKAARGDARPGFMTPSKAYGADLILEFDGVTRTDV